MTTVDRIGAELRATDVLVEHLPEGVEVQHPIDHFAPYPGRFYGYNFSGACVVVCADGWRCTAGDREHFHVQIRQEN